MDKPIAYDPENIDVAGIMAQIKDRVAGRPPVTETPIPCGAAAVPVPGPTGWKGLVKKGVRFLIRPYMPFLTRAFDRFVFKATLGVNTRIDEAATRLGTTMETTKLLHNLSHNLVLELTKLRVETDALKSKVRVMEKDFEVLGRRERVLEKQAGK